MKIRVAVVLIFLLTFLASAYSQGPIINYSKYTASQITHECKQPTGPGMETTAKLDQTNPTNASVAVCDAFYQFVVLNTPATGKVCVVDLASLGIDSIKTVSLGEIVVDAESRHDSQHFAIMRLQGKLVAKSMNKNYDDAPVRCD
jgi:hypothetical protein